MMNINDLYTKTNGGLDIILFYFPGFVNDHPLKLINGIWYFSNFSPIELCMLFEKVCIDTALAILCERYNNNNILGFDLIQKSFKSNLENKIYDPRVNSAYIFSKKEDLTDLTKFDRFSLYKDEEFKYNDFLLVRSYVKNIYFIEGEIALKFFDITPKIIIIPNNNDGIPYANLRDYLDNDMSDKDELTKLLLLEENSFKLQRHQLCTQLKK